MAMNHSDLRDYIQLKKEIEILKYELDSFKRIIKIQNTIIEMNRENRK